MITARDKQTNRFRILAIANETVEGDALRQLIADHAAGRPAEVVVVAPALNSRIRHWLSDEDGARHEAEDRLYRTLGRLEDSGLLANGWVGDANPLEAIADALVVFEADQLIIATHPEQRSNWLAHDVVDRARERFALPTAHVTVWAATGQVAIAA